MPRDDAAEERMRREIARRMQQSPEERELEELLRKKTHRERRKFVNTVLEIHNILLTEDITRDAIRASKKRKVDTLRRMR